MTRAEIDAQIDILNAEATALKAQAYAKVAEIQRLVELRQGKVTIDLTAETEKQATDRIKAVYASKDAILSAGVAK